MDKKRSGGSDGDRYRPSYRDAGGRCPGRRITNVSIVNASEQSLTTVKAGDIIHAKSDANAQELTYCGLKMNTQTKVWSKYANNSATFTVPANVVPGEKLCVLLSFKDNIGPYAFSPSVTVMMLM